MKLDRLLGIIQILSNVEKTTIKDLAERFEVSRRTIFRDLDILSQAGIPIVSYPGYGGGVGIVEGYKVDHTVLSKADQENLYTALQGLKSIQNDQVIASLIAKLVPEDTDAVISRAAYSIDLSSWFHDSLAAWKLNVLRDAIEACRVVQIEYISRNSRSIRRLEPYKLVFKQSNWYLYAYCLLRNEFRLFHLNRIVGLDVTETFYIPKAVDNPSYPPDLGKGLFHAENGQSMYQIILAYDKDNEFTLTDSIDGIFFERAPDATVGYIKFKVSDLEWTASLLMSILDKIRVIEPLELKEQIRKRIKTINLFYEGDI